MTRSDCRDQFENDYQLDSDVETFENLTGKKIRPIIPPDESPAGDESRAVWSGSRAHFNQLAR